MNTSTDTPGTTVTRRTRSRAILFLALALLAGLAAVFLVHASLDRARRAARSVAHKTTPVVVAAMDIPVGTNLEARHLKILGWPVEGIPAGSFRNQRPLLGKPILTSLLAGEPVLRGRIAGSRRGSGMAALLAPGRRAMSVKVDQVIGVGGFVQPGDYVDVITIMAPDDEVDRALNAEPARISKIILQNIRVLAVGEHLQTRGNEPVRVQAVTLEVDPQESERLALGSLHGQIQLTIRSRIDQIEVATTGITPSILLLPQQVAAVAAQPRPVPPTPWSARTIGPRPVTRSLAADVEQRPAPVVEILRPGRVEERQLRPSADSQRNQ